MHDVVMRMSQIRHNNLQICRHTSTGEHKALQYSAKLCVSQFCLSVLLKHSKIGNGWKSFNTRTIESSPASRSTFLHTTWLRLPTLEELMAIAEDRKLSLKAQADSEIAWRQDAVDAGIATDEETAALSEWKKYRVLLMRVDTAKPVCPVNPQDI